MRPSCLHCRGHIIGDPHVTGFDGSKFPWHGVGPTEVLREADGWVVSATFSTFALSRSTQVTWTTAVQIQAPNGAPCSSCTPARTPLPPAPLCMPGPQALRCSG